MRINTNLLALNTKNQLKNNNKVTSKIMEKLSSGKRINKAADDAAGLAISQKMHTQIRGLGQASRNAQDGISLVQTAEGGLSEINNITQRMRELCVQGSNDILTKSDRESIQIELDELKSEIGNIADHTKFNTKELLRPPIIEDSTPIINTGKSDIIFVVDNTGSMAGTQTEVANNIGDFINSITAKGVDDIRMGVVEYYDSIINKHEFSGNKWTSDTENIKDKLLELATTNSGATENAMQAVSETIDSYDFRDNNGAQTKNIILITNEDADDDSNMNVNSTLTKLEDEGVQLHGVYRTAAADVEEFDKLINSTGGKSVNLNDSNWGTQLSDIIGTHIGETGGTIEKDEMATHILQIGANSGQTMEIFINDMRPEALGFTDKLPSVNPIEMAGVSLSLSDEAINKINLERTKLGAKKNRLEHVIKNVNNASENIQNAESRIADADMAKQAMELAKNDILIQASQSMLSQANVLPQSVLELIK